MHRAFAGRVLRSCFRLDYFPITCRRPAWAGLKTLFHTSANPCRSAPAQTTSYPKRNHSHFMPELSFHPHSLVFSSHLCCRLSFPLLSHPPRSLVSLSRPPSRRLLPRAIIPTTLTLTSLLFSSLLFSSRLKCEGSVAAAHLSALSSRAPYPW